MLNKNCEYAFRACMVHAAQSLWNTDILHLHFICSCLFTYCIILLYHDYLLKSYWNHIIHVFQHRPFLIFLFQTLVLEISNTASSALDESVLFITRVRKICKWSNFKPQRQQCDQHVLVAGMLQSSIFAKWHQRKDWKLCLRWPHSGVRICEIHGPGEPKHQF